MDHFFRSLKSEWMLQTGYEAFNQAKAVIIDYLMGYCSQVRPHQHNEGLAPNAAERKYWAVAKFT
jgi:putative transposase